MSDRVILLFLAGLRRRDLDAMPRLRALLAPGDEAVLAPSFPCLAGPVEANLLTGVTPDRHGIVADNRFDRSLRTIERNPALFSHLEQPLIGEILRQHDPRLASSIIGFESHVGRGAAPRDNLKAAIDAARQSPDFLYLYLADLADVAQRCGPDSHELQTALSDVDDMLGELIASVEEAYGSPAPLWLVTGGFTVSQVASVFLPNRVLYEAGWLELRDGDDGPIADLKRSRAFALADRQVSHVFVADGQPATIAQVAKLFCSLNEIEETLVGEERRRFDLEHRDSGDVVLISAPDSWQAYPWWSDREEAPEWARRTEAVHKLGADPLELFASDGQVPLDLTLIKGSHGAPARDERQRSIILSSEPGVIAGGVLADTDICDLVLRQFGI
ncbi:MAG TPA: alkaline phosphatase family protein [Pirellulales bacterium]|nr:alkaline phosphatase family protein [Pirellulales bacterium]